MFLVADCEKSRLFAYIRYVRALPTLTPNEENDLLEKWCLDKNKSAAQLLTKSHLKLVVKIAKKFVGYGLSMMDIISEGNVGLLNAIKKFDLKKKCRLATYAIWHIRAAIQSYILGAWSMVKAATTQTKRKLFFNLRKIKRQIEGASSGKIGLLPPTSEEINNEIVLRTSADIASIREMSKHLSLRDTSIDVSSDSSKIGGLINQIAASNPFTPILNGNEKRIALQSIAQAFKELDNREKAVFIDRIITGKTLKDIGKTLNISTERVRQLHVRSIKKIREFVRQYLGSKEVEHMFF